MEIHRRERVQMFYLAQVEGGHGAVTEGAKALITTHQPGHEEAVIILWTWVAIALIVIFAFLARSGFGVIPRGWGAVFEHIYDWIAEQAVSMMGSVGLRYVPFVMTIFLFVLTSNWMGLIPLPGIKAAPTATHAQQAGPPVEGEAAPQAATHGGAVIFPPMEAPTSNLHTTLALALISFFGFTFFGLQKHYERARFGGHRAHDGDGHEGGPPHPTRDPVSAALTGFVTWLLHFVEPTPTLWNSLDGALKYLLVPPLCVLFVFLNVIEEFARIVSLTIRLFGNIFGEHQVKIGLFGAMALFSNSVIGALKFNMLGAAAGNTLMTLLLWASSVFVTILGTLAGFIQAFIFMVLTLSYISHVVAEEH